MTLNSMTFFFLTSVGISTYKISAYAYCNCWVFHQNIQATYSK